MNADRLLQVVVKSSKFCNLRCNYCYEFADLGKREFMAQADLTRMFRHIHSYVTERDRADGATTQVAFIWHGGEPLLLPPSYYRTAMDSARSIFGDRPVRNLVQTNLTRLDPERIDLLRSGFDNVGVSVDLYGGLRVNIAGRDSQPGVLRNMDVLRDEGIRFTCITVLTALNVTRVEDIFRFYQKHDISFRVLPLFNGAFDSQHATYELENHRIVRALCQLFDLWLESSSTISVAPLQDYLMVALRHLAGEQLPYHNRREWLPVVLVDTNGDSYAFGDEFGSPESRLGNIFAEPLADMLNSPRYDKSALAAEKRMAANCLNCEYFGACSGGFVADGETSERDIAANGLRMCNVERAVIGHMVRRLRDVPGAADAYRLSMARSSTAAALQA